MSFVFICIPVCYCQ